MLFGNTSIDTLVCLDCGESFSLGDIAIEKVKNLKVPAKIKATGIMFSMFVCPNCGNSYIGFIPSKAETIVSIPTVWIDPVEKMPEIPFVEATHVDPSIIWTGEGQKDYVAINEESNVVDLPANEDIDSLTVGQDIVGLTVEEPKAPLGNGGIRGERALSILVDEDDSVDEKVEKINNSINEDDFSNLRKPKKRRGPPVVQKVKCTSCGKMTEVGAGFSGDFGTKCSNCLKDALRNRKG